MKDRREPRWCPVCSAELTRWAAAVRGNDGPPECDLALDAPPDALVRGQTVRVDVIARDHDGLAALDATLDGRAILHASRAFVEPSQAAADGRFVLGPGSHVLAARCRDNEGQESTRELVLHVR